MSEYENYQSTFSWRYASLEMRRIWSEVNKRLIWRRIWVALAETQAEFGLVTAAQVEDVRSHAGQVDMKRALEIEAEIHHDLMAELKTFAEQCPVGGGSLHLGATSADIEDNADALRIRDSLRLILHKLKDLLLMFARTIEENAGLPVMGYTHLQPAEPTTFGYRLAVYAQDLLADYQTLSGITADVRGKGFKGAVGTGAAYADLLGKENVDKFEARLSEKLGLEFFPVTSQIYPRRQDYRVICALAGVGATLHKFAFDLRLLQSPVMGEWSEPFDSQQVGSSAMPFKRNPINAEKIDSLARQLSIMPQVAWHNAANSLLERTLDDSANRRALLPEAFLITDELLTASNRILGGMKFNQTAIQRNLQTYAPFACTERILMAAARAGVDRQVVHERLRHLSLTAWEAVQAGEANPLVDLVKKDGLIREVLGEGDIERLSDISSYLGLAEAHAINLAERIRRELNSSTLD